MELLAAEPNIVPPLNPLPFPETGRGRIVFETVSFSYPSRADTRAINAFSLEVEPGETVAITFRPGTLALDGERETTVGQDDDQATRWRPRLWLLGPQVGPQPVQGRDLRSCSYCRS